MTTALIDTAGNAALGQLRINLIRAGYLFLVLGLAITKWPLLPEAHELPLYEGVTLCLLTAMSLLALAGLRYPLRLLPIMLFETTWKISLARPRRTTAGGVRGNGQRHRRGGRHLFPGAGHYRRHAVGPRLAHLCPPEQGRRPMTQLALASETKAVDRSAKEGRHWRLLVAHLALSVIPLVSGALRLVEIAGGPELLPANPRIASSPAPLVLHVIGAAVFVLLGAFQFSARLRRSRPGWHRRSGRLVAGAGMVVAASGLWMTLFYPDAPGGVLLWTVRVAVSTLTGAFIAMGFTAIRRRQVKAHRAWMIRAYALSVGAGTQVFTEGIGEALLGTNDLGKALSMTAAWGINGAIAEWAIRRRTPARRT